MTIAATTVWRLRPGGNAANGAGYDSAISGAVTDYSQQNAAQLSVADVVTVGTTTVTSVTGGFTSAMIGNAIKITGDGYYFITARASTNSITVDRNTGTAVGQTGKVGGAADLPSTLGSVVVPGNIVYILGVNGDAASYPTSTDYTETGFFTPTVGNFSAGWIKWIKDPNGSIPTLQSNGLYFYNFTSHWFESLYFTASGSSNGTNGIIQSAANVVIKNCIFNLQDRAGLAAINLAANVASVMGCDIYGGSATPSAQNSGCHGILCAAYNIQIIGNWIHNVRDAGISESNSVVAIGNIITGCKGDSIYSNNPGTIASTIANNTLDSGSGHGINLNATANSTNAIVFNNIISNHLGASKYAINVVVSSTALNDFIKRLIDYNNIYNCTANYNNISAGGHDTTVNPNFVSSSNYTPQEPTLEGTAFPVTIP